MSPVNPLVPNNQTSPTPARRASRRHRWSVVVGTKGIGRRLAVVQRAERGLKPSRYRSSTAEYGSVT